MKFHFQFFIVVAFALASSFCFGQDITLWQQFNGRFDYTFVGNTLNTAENNTDPDCIINTSSSAALSLNSGDKVEKAYLYWAGSGSGIFNVNLNDTPVAAQRTFSFLKNSLIYFSAFADVTPLIQNTGNGNYVFSGMDLNPIISNSPYCDNRTDFGGWVLVIIYQNDSLPLNQLNVYDGLQGIPDTVSIMLNSLNVIDNAGAKIAFVAWEGDSTLSVNETLRINGNILSNSLNPSDNAFNSTNTFTNSTTLYNMDLDEYDIQNNIKIGDSKALIELTSGADFVLINTIVTKLNSQLPDATISIDKASGPCNAKTVDVDYTVYNLNSTDVLPANVPVAIYIDGVFVKKTNTGAVIPIGESQTNTVSVDIPAGTSNIFSLTLKVDSDENGVGTVTETNENNNDFSLRVILPISPTFNTPPNLDSCNEGYEKGTFNFSNYDQLIKTNSTDTVTFFNTQADASANENPIVDTAHFVTMKSTTKIFVRIENTDHCESYTSFLLIVKNCPPIVHNWVNPTSGGLNSTFQIEGLRDVFLNFKLSIFNRWGALVWIGNHGTDNWDGSSNQGLHVMGTALPEGTYFYVLDLNDPDYPNGMSGYLYLKR